MFFFIHLGHIFNRFPQANKEAEDRVWEEEIVKSINGKLKHLRRGKYAATKDKED